MILLNPGPVNVSDRVRNALLQPDICHRESEFSELLADIRQKLLKAFVPGEEDEYTAIVLTGSGTAAVEAALMSSMPVGKRAMVITNGVYGQRMSSMILTQRLGTPDLKYDWGVAPDPQTVDLALKQHPEVHTVAMVHHETTLGMINPVKEIAEIVDRHNRVFLLDSVSGLGGETLDIAGNKIYMVAGAAQKCIQGFPGAAFVLVRKGFMERVMKYPKRCWYLNLANYYEEQERGTIPFTPAVQVYYAFREALNELLEEGVENRIQRFQGYAATIRTRLEEWGVKPVLAPALRGNTLTAFYLPEGCSYQWLHDGLKQSGYVIYAGQGQLEEKIFRVANIGALTSQDIDGFVSAFQTTVARA
ncbi:MAG: alanine--glyoxylate aminotransferase family protein [Nitrospirota bacterium]|jgi:2-aminoethylphosphonate-pyruvate transaminase|nr:alanine--glyoxylate aminotransferase family protein [Nitrospirota bacterium]MDH4359803.1 alanine--glyoxylate aminotransferase family protein [Nitrospirota bacterium]MDH5573854.1 alanine--glyoxylate aminotransferase family protein [Nitrospirota bacterium]